MPAPEVPAPVVLLEPADGPFGLGAVDAGGIAELEGVAELGGVAELVGAPVPLSVLPAPLGDGVPVCGVVGVHATIAATTSEAAAARRRGCERYMKQLLRYGERTTRQRGRCREARKTCAPCARDVPGPPRPPDWRVT